MSEPLTQEVEPELAYKSDQVIQLAEESLDVLAGLSVPGVYEYEYPDPLLAVWAWLKEYVHKKRDFSQLALGLPRGFSKTMIMKLFILYCVLYTDKKFILIVCETATKAVNILTDVMDMLNEDNIRQVYGDWRVGAETDRQELKKFGFRGRNITLLAAGAGTGIRGITIKNERPDIMLFDDIQSKEDSESELLSNKLEAWLYSTAMKAKSPKGCMFLFVANMYPTKGSLLRRLKTNPNWLKYIVGGILADGSSLWEGLQPIKQLLREYQNDIAAGHPEVFHSEVLNDENAAANNLINIDDIPAPTFQDGDFAVGKFIIIDPAVGKANGDMIAIGYFEVHDAKPVLKELINELLSPGDTIRRTLELALRTGTSLIAIESVAYQATLAYWFQMVCQQLEITGIDAVEIYPGRKSKNSRIIAMLRELKSGDTCIDPKLLAEVMYQASQFNPLTTENVDDILDLLCYAPKVMEAFADEIISLNIIEQQELDSLEVIDDPSWGSAF